MYVYQLGGVCVSFRGCTAISVLKKRALVTVLVKGLFEPLFGALIAPSVPVGHGLMVFLVGFGFPFYLCRTPYDPGTLSEITDFQCRRCKKLNGVALRFHSHKLGEGQMQSKPVQFLLKYKFNDRKYHSRTFADMKSVKLNAHAIQPCSSKNLSAKRRDILTPKRCRKINKPCSLVGHQSEEKVT